MPRLQRQIEATGDTTTISTSYVPMNGVSITPGAGEYMVWFSTSILNTDNNSTVWLGLCINGILQTHTEREVFIDKGSTSVVPVSIQMYITGLSSGEPISVYWKVSRGTAIARERTLTMVRVR